MTYDFTDQVVLVTGAANGVGRATAEAFGRAGAWVFAADFDMARGEALAAGIRDAGGRCDFVAADMADEAATQRLFDQIQADAGRLDIAINNAAIDLEVGAEAGRWDVATTRRVWAVNLEGVFLCMRAELEIMERQRAGAIVNISSLAGLIGVMGKPAYTAAKHGVIGLTRAAALQYGPSGIRVNAICPSAIRTEMFKIQGLTDERLEASHPLRRIAEPSDIADAALWLSSNESRHVTGHPLVIDAGYMAY